MARLLEIQGKHNYTGNNVKLWVSDYFDDLINDVDVYTETQLLNRALNLAQINDINLIRSKFIDAITIIKQSNLNLIDDCDNHGDLVMKFKEKLIKEADIIKASSFLIIDEDNEGHFKLKLVLLDWYFDSYQKKLLKYVFKFFIFN
jgi:hypothetical protein